MGSMMVNPPLYTGIAAAFLMLMQLVLMFRVINQRRQSGVNIGDGGVAALELRMRVHGNFIENVPAFLIVLALIETLSGSTLWVALLGGVFIIARVAHAIGFSLNPGATPGRVLGTLVSIVTMLAAAVYLAYLVLRSMG